MKRYIKSTENISTVAVRLGVIGCVNEYLDDYYSVTDETENSWEVEVEQDEDLKPFVNQLYNYLNSRIECDPIKKTGFDYTFTVGKDITVRISYEEYSKFGVFVVEVI